MPIYDLSYRHWTGVPLPRSQRWLPIAQSALFAYFRKRMFIVWMIVCWLPALVLGVLVYLRVNMNVAELPDVDARVFHMFLTAHVPLHLLTAVFVGSGLIANDRRTNALQIYLSKPLRPLDYLLGKGATVAGVLALVVLGPSLTLFLFRVGLDRDGEYLASHWSIPLSLTGASALIIATLTVLALTFSSLTRSGRAAGVALVMFSAFAKGFQAILGALFSRDASSLLSPFSNLEQGLDLLLSQAPTYGVHPLWSMLALAGMLAICLRVLWKRVRPVEIVA